MINYEINQDFSGNVSSAKISDAFGSKEISAPFGTHLADFQIDNLKRDLGFAGTLDNAERVVKQAFNI
jgi:hypothetical protein